MRDTHAGASMVKAKRELYLPKTRGMAEQGKAGEARYDAYLQRAHFPTVLRDAVEKNIGVMHHKPPKIELPTALEPLRESATPFGESLEVLLRRINEEQLITGRLGLLLDGNRTRPLPFIVFYRGEHVINWDDGTRDDPNVGQVLNLVVLQESEPERTMDFEWEYEEKWRVLALGDLQTNEQDGVYRAATVRDENAFSEAEMIVPSLRGRTLDFIPFVFCNTKDIVPDPDEPPFHSLADLALTIYRGDADYRQALFTQAQDTLVVTGDSNDDDKSYSLGAGSVIRLPTGASAEFIGVSSDGIPHMRESLIDLQNVAAMKGGELLETVSREKESSAALNTRVAAKTASLNQIAMAGAYALEKSLKQAAQWVGANPDQVSVKPNLDFAGGQAQPRSFVDLMTAKGMGMVISHESIHALLKDQDFTELEYDAEKAKVDEENEAEMEQAARNAEVMGLAMGGGADNVERTDDTDEEASDSQPGPNDRG